MPTHVVYPKVSLEMSSGRIARWLVAEGETVRQGQVLFEIDNDKAAVEVESPASGIIRALLDSEVEVEVGGDVARIYGEGENDGGFEARAAASGQAPDRAEAAILLSSIGKSRERPNPTPLARRLAREHGVSLEGVSGTGPNGRVQKTDVMAKIGGGVQPLRPVAPEAPGLAIPRRSETANLNAVWLRKGEGQPVVLLHGFSADLNNWRGMLAGARADWPALALDLPAHGGSPRTVPDDLDRMAACVEATLSAESVGPLTLVGHSFGGALAARLASRGQIDIRALCLISPAGLGPQINGAFVDGVLRARRKESLRPWLELLAQEPSVISPAFVQAVVAQREDDGLTAAMRALAERFFPDGTQSISIRGDLARLSQPVRILFGRQDRILPFNATTGLPGHIGLHALDACGHMPHLEHPELVMRLIGEVRRSG